MAITFTQAPVYWWHILTDTVRTPPAEEVNDSAAGKKYTGLPSHADLQKLLVSERVD